MKKLPETVVDAIGEPGVAELLADNAEIAIDGFLDDGVLKDIPVLGNIFKVYSVSQSIANNLFTRKLLTFLRGLSSISSERRRKFVAELDDDETFKHRVGEKLLLLVEGLDDVQKAEYLATAFRFYITGDVSYRDFQILATIIDRFNLAYALDVRSCFRYRTSETSPELLDHLVACGIVRSGRGEHQMDMVRESEGAFCKTQMGIVFVTHVLPADSERVKDWFIKQVLDIPITASIGDQETDVTRLRARAKLSEQGRELVSKRWCFAV